MADLTPTLELFVTQAQQDAIQYSSSLQRVERQFEKSVSHGFPDGPTVIDVSDVSVRVIRTKEVLKDFVVEAVSCLYLDGRPHVVLTDGNVLNLRVQVMS